MSNRRSARNRHRGPMPALPQIRKSIVDQDDFVQLVHLGQQLIPKVHAQALWNSAELTRSGVPAQIVALLASAGAVGRRVAQVIAKHYPMPEDGALPDFDPCVKEILQALSLLEPAVAPEAPPEPSGPVADETDLALRAQKAGLVIAR